MRSEFEFKEGPPPGRALVFEFRRDSSGGLHLVRNTPPRLDIAIKDDATARELANALRAGAEFVRKIARLEEKQT